MKIGYLLIVLFLLQTSIGYSQNSSFQTDSISIVKTYQHLKKNKHFLCDLGLQNDKHFQFNDWLTNVVVGDLNGDGEKDALLSFSVEARNGGNNYELYYIIFLGDNNCWKYQGVYPTGSDVSRWFYHFDKIENRVVYGILADNNEEEESKLVLFIWNGQKLIEKD